MIEWDWKNETFKSWSEYLSWTENMIYQKITCVTFFMNSM